MYFVLPARITEETDHKKCIKASHLLQEYH